MAKTFVMERGKVGRLLSQLVLDLRHVMEPHTASKLKVGRTQMDHCTRHRRLPNFCHN